MVCQARPLHLSWLLPFTFLHLVTGSCSGSSIHCDGASSQSSCEFWSGCTWSASSGSTSSCTGSFSTCASKTTEASCNNWAGCNWGTTSGSGSSGSTGGLGLSQSFCFAKLDGGHCSGNTAFTCKDGKITASQYCSAGDCKTFGLEASCGDPNFCTGKLSGKYCDGQYVKACDSGSLSTSVEVQDCRSAGCSQFTVGEASCGTANFCAAKIAGKYCDDQVVKSCPSNEVEGVCRDVACQESASTRTASCGSATFCRTKLDGSYCDGAYLKTCTDKTQTALVYCGKCSDAGVGAAECGTPRFCTAKISGDYCDGDVWKRCDGSATPNSAFFCEGGCVEWRVGVAGCGAQDDGFVGQARGQIVGTALLGLALEIF